MSTRKAAELPSKLARSVPIRVKLLLMITVVSTLTLTLALLAIYRYEQRTAIESELEQTAAKAALIAANLKPAVIFSDALTATKALKNIDADPALLSAVVRLPDGSVFAEYGSDRASFGQSRIHYQAIQLNGESIGKLELRVSLAALQARERSTLKVAGLVFSVGFIISFILALAFQRVILVPVMAMLSHLHRIQASSNYSLRLNMKRFDELGDLAKGIDHMVAAVEERDIELQRDGEQLQKLVEVRTQQLNQKAYYDSLTGLANRDLLNDRLRHAIEVCDREGSALALLFLDLDRFKVVNDSLGHRVGDKLLKVIGSRLSQSGRSGDTVARLGGDEFVRVMEHLTDSEDAARGAQRILQALDEPFAIDGHRIHCNTSIGIALYPQDSNSVDELLKCADLAMYHAKDRGRGCFSFYTDELNASSYDRLKLETAIRVATEKLKFYLVYQPKVDLRTRRICGFEALIRSSDEFLASVGPEAFMTAADELGLSHHIGNWAIHEVFRQMAEWSESGIQDLSVAVNVTANQLLSSGLQNVIAAAASYHQVSKSRLQIEIVENVFLKYSDQVVRVLKALRESGISIAVDDFGTGYSSMQYLQQFPLDTLKLDGMFVREFGDDSNSAGIISSVIVLAHSLGLDIVAEGVETSEQLSYLKSQSCDIAQGYLFAKPMLAADISSENLAGIEACLKTQIKSAAA